MTASLYRKYRPQTFGEVVGQDAISRTLRNAISQNKVSHAYLFCGPRGTGKTTTARLMAKALLCKCGPTPDPDGTCDECLQIADGIHPDVYELDAASRTGVENVREEIIGRVNFAPTRGRSKVYIIDEVHMLSVAAFNALLKTLEEPPGHVVFILCTTDPQKVPATIHSRCQRFDFHRISNEEIVSRLGAVCVAEDVQFEPEALDLIASRSEGGMRNALTALEQLIVFCEGKVSLAGAESLLGSLDSGDMATVMESIGRRDGAACFNWLADYVDSGADLAQFVRDMTSHVRNLYVLSIAGEDAPVEITDEERKRCEIELPYYSVDRLSRLLGILGELQNELRFSNNPRLSFEIALTRMVRPDSDITLEALAERVATLEKALAARPVAAAPAPVPASAAVPAAAPVAAAPASAPAPAPAAVPAPAPRSAAPAPTPAPAPAPVRPAAAPAPAPSSGVSQVAPSGFPRSPEPLRRHMPQPAPAPATAPVSRADVPASNGAVPNLKNPAALQRSWQSVLNIMKKEKAAYGVFFLNTVVSANDAGDQIVVTYPAGSDFAFDAVRKPDVQAALARAVAMSFGSEIPVVLQKAGGGSATVAPAAASAPAPAAAPAPAPRTAPAPASAPAPAAAPAVPEPLTRHKAPAPAPRPAVQDPMASTADDPMLRAPSRRPLASMAPGPDYDYDEVPLDAYESMGSPTDYDPGYYDDSPHMARPAATPASAPAPAPAPAPKPAPAPRPTPVPAAAPAPKPAPAPAPAPKPAAGGVDSVEDIQNLLSSSFGNEIIFEEIE